MNRLSMYICMLVFCAIVVAESTSFNVHMAEAQTNANGLTPEQETQLRTELSQVERQIEEQQQILNSKKTEGTSLERDVAILNAQIKQAQLKIRAHEISINKLGKDITIKTNTIQTLEQRIGSSKESLVEILQKSREIEDFNLVDALLSNKDISEFFVDVDSYTSLKDSLQSKLYEIRNAKSENEIAKKELDNQRVKELDTKISVENEQSNIKKAEDAKKRLLTLNKNEQLNYQTVIKDNQKKAQEIRNTLFKLRDSDAIKFGDAVTLAKRASSKTGVRAAYVLAIIQQESNLGANVGQCYLTDETTGEGRRISGTDTIKNVMKASRDVAPFKSITTALGRDWTKTVVSCPFKIGFGGAMGPAQFIPSTWAIFEDKIAANVGRPSSDPWNPEDAFMASAIYLADLGAATQSYTAERNAACRYYSGRSCSGTNAFYGDQVMGRIKNLQNNIDILQN